VVRGVLPEYVYVNLEDPKNRAIADEAPRAFLKRFSGRTILDEIQRVPHLLSYPGDPAADRHVEPPGGVPTSPAGIRLTGRSGHRAVAFARKGNVARGSPPLALKIGTSGLEPICLRRVYHRTRGRLRSVRMQSSALLRGGVRGY
jgi:hypothetical protein